MNLKMFINDRNLLPSFGGAGGGFYPAGAMAAVSYGLGTEYQKAESLKIYTMLGALVAEINLRTNSDDLPLDISRFPSGTYIISLQADGKTVLHQKLVKK